MAAYLMSGGVSKNGSPPCSACTSTPSARSSMTLLRICTMSENPTSSRRFASLIPLSLVDMFMFPFVAVWGEVSASSISDFRFGAFCGSGRRTRKTRTVSHCKRFRINRHADHRVGAQPVERIHLLLAANAAGDNELPSVSLRSRAAVSMGKPCIRPSPSTCV